MSQITRKSTLLPGRIGHYEVKGTIYATHNYESAEMAYGGTLGLFFQRGDPTNIRKTKVKQEYQALQRVHPLLVRNDLPKLTYALATDVEFKELIVGEDDVGIMIRYSHPSLLALLFPHLYPTCTGHYSMVPTNTYEFDNRLGAYGIPENQGGVANATWTETSIEAYAKQSLLMRDRRRKSLTQKDVVNQNTGKHNKNIVSTCIFENLGFPQLFLTFTCDDKSADFKNIQDEDTKFPWEDPVLFSQHFRRRWIRFFKIYIQGHFARQIGGIKDYSWVMEIQDRGSPHIHMVLWTEKSVQELIDMNVVHTRFPPGTSIDDPLLHSLVNNLQIHRCNDNYCKRGDPTKKCRFGYPKPYAPSTELDTEHRCIYKRDVGDAYVNNYNPYLLSVFRTGMDIQYNDGPQAVRYFAKYLAKDDYEAKILLKNIQQQNQGYYKRTSYVSGREHYAARIVDSKRLRDDIKDIDSSSNQIFARTHVDIYEKREGAPDLTLTEFFSFYKRNYSKKMYPLIQNVTRSFYYGQQPNFVYSSGDLYQLITDKPFAWRTFNQREMNSQSFYYQQIVTKKPIFNTTFENEKGPIRSWKDYYEYLINLEEGGIEVHRRLNIQSVNDVVDAERACMLVLRNNSTVFVSGAAGTGKSYVLRMLERHYEMKGYKVFKLAPTGVAAHNISGDTLHPFFGITNRSSVPNFLKLDEYGKLYPKLLLLIDEYSMVSSKLLESVSEALIKTTQRSSSMGGIKTVFFGDIAQLLPVQKMEGLIWESEIYTISNRYNLIEPVRQKETAFVEILEKVRNYNFDEAVIQFINKRTIHKNNLPQYCLRLYTTRERVRLSNEKDYKDFPGDGKEFAALDSYVGNKRTAKISLRETRLLETLLLKQNMPVMLVHNLNVSQGWVNGTIAAVEYMEEENIYLRKRLPDGSDCIYWIQRVSRQVPNTSYTRTQYPIVPAFASTIYKSQSATIDCVGIHLDNMMSHGQLYVAMSRVRKSEDLYFFGADMPLSV
ncbi:hypothetical protein INT47_013068 [Mucor saturninus]|uniref:ATP-dependent DNA helicase n=1 Tax=Mucor saturninus TaxID=64648 RepID=A0A8H7QFF9_9FUNG|nr:hypothetical protein INT47_013068 [Mucor saturninus]